MVGSHTDTVTGGGRFDGIAGVVVGLEIVRMLKETGIQLEHSLEIVDFTAEEPTDFGVSTVGSRGMVGNLSEDMRNSRDPEGRVLIDCITEAGGNPARLEQEARKQGSVAAYLELHIEQGPVLMETS
ncbi:M20/M25/M40 family metallo-hydrolase, partial [Paenibacillus sp. MCAF20]